MLTFVASIQALNTACISEDADGRDKPGHDGGHLENSTKKPAPKGRLVWSGGLETPGQNWYFSVAFTVRPGSL